MSPSEKHQNSQAAYELGYQLGKDGWTTHPLPELVKEFIEELLKLNPDPEVLDIGCGRGVKSELLAKLGPKVIGVDYSETAIKQAIELKNKSEVGERLHFFQGDVREISKQFPENFVEGIFDYQCLASVPPEFWLNVSEGYYHILKPGGSVLIDFLHSDGAYFHGDVKDKLHGKKEYILEPDLKNPAHKDLEWEKGLYIKFVDDKEVEEFCGNRFKVIKRGQRFHSSETDRLLVTYLLKSLK